MSPNSATNFVVSISKGLALSPAATLYYVYIILGDPGAVRRRRKLSRTGKESPWDATLTEPVPRLIWVLASDWAQKVIFDKHSNELRNWFFLQGGEGVKRELGLALLWTGKMGLLTGTGI